MCLATSAFGSCRPGMTCLGRRFEAAASWHSCGVQGSSSSVWRTMCGDVVLPVNSVNVAGLVMAACLCTGLVRHVLGRSEHARARKKIVPFHGRTGPTVPVLSFRRVSYLLTDKKDNRASCSECAMAFRRRKTINTAQGSPPAPLGIPHKLLLLRHSSSMGISSSLPAVEPPASPSTGASPSDTTSSISISSGFDAAGIPP
jgi:hypothetical protein